LASVLRRHGGISQKGSYSTLNFLVLPFFP
jgi:hypothetical protein